MDEVSFSLDLPDFTFEQLDGVQQDNRILIDRIPPELIVHIFSFLDAFSIVNTSLACKTFYRLTSDQQIWKRLFKVTFPALYATRFFSQEANNSLDSSINWKGGFYQHVHKLNDNYLLLRKKLCSFISRDARVTAELTYYYLSFDKEGQLSAIARRRRTQKIKNLEGRVERIEKNAWNMRIAIQLQFAFLAIFDANASFVPTIKLGSMEPLNPFQIDSICFLREKINYWFERTKKMPNLDARINKILTHPYYATKQIRCIQGEEKLSVEHKAYFLFFQELVDDIHIESANPRKRVMASYIHSQSFEINLKRSSSMPSFISDT